MILFLKTPMALAAAFVIATTGSSFAQDFNPPSPAPSFATNPEKPVTAQPVSYNGYSCDMVRAKVAESGLTAAYAYARYMGLSHRDISKVRKACSV